MSDQAPIHRVGGHVALDFANTVSWRGTPRQFDHIDSVPALMCWAEGAGLIDRAAAAPEHGDAFLARAHRLRAAVRGTFEGAVTGTEAKEDRAALLDIARACLASAELTGLPAELRHCSTEGAILGAIAWAAITLLSSERIGRVKICEPDSCRWLFLDTTKNGSRRWCDMGACGNRAKVTQHRVRQKRRTVPTS
jgi:predicted RNA-binding Zn ribbon-like protein